MKTYNFFSAIQTNYFIHLKNFLKTLKKFKKDGVVYNYTIMIDDLDIDYFKKELEFLNDSTFNLICESSYEYQFQIRPHIGPYIFYMRCLLPSIFPNLDKILYFDTDMIVLKQGIEQFYDTDITDYYLAACWDQMDLLEQKIMSKNENYFNSGVLLFNLKKIREDGKDEQMKKYLLDWPQELKESVLHDQTLINYVYRDHVLLCSLIYNNTLSFADNRNYHLFQAYYKQFGYEEPYDSIKDTVILHFIGRSKPWGFHHVHYFSNLKYYHQLKELYEKSIT